MARRRSKPRGIDLDLLAPLEGGGGLYWYQDFDKNKAAFLVITWGEEWRTVTVQQVNDTEPHSPHTLMHETEIMPGTVSGCDCLGAGQGHKCYHMTAAEKAWDLVCQVSSLVNATTA